MSRPSRRTKKPARISASHFVGYVEDDESVEAIMKKFEALEEYKNELSSTVVAPTTTREAPEGGSAAAAEVLSEEQLQEIFKRTSGFTVELALRDDYADDDDDFWKEQLGYDSDDAEFGFLAEDLIEDEEEETDRGARAAALPSRKRRAAPVVRQVNKIMHYQLADRNGNLFTIKRRVRHVDPFIPTYTKVPSWPLPLSWAHIVRPFNVQAIEAASVSYMELPILRMDKPTVKKLGNAFQGIYINAPLQVSDDDATPGRISLKQLSVLPVADLCTNGFLFIWVDKRQIANVVQLAAETWSYKLVENLCWIRLNRNNTMANEPAPYINCSKLMLLMFRKVPLVEIEIRHQRSPDCVFDFVRPSSATSDKPGAVFETIETLLPQAVWSPANHTCSRLLYLWAPKDFSRPGWTTIHNVEKGV